MPSRKTLADAKAERISNALRICDTDPRLVSWINEAQQRLIPLGSWWGLWARYKCNATEGMLVWPRQVAAILAASIQQVPVKIRDPFFEFIELGMGIQDTCNASCQFLTPDSTWPVFSPIVGNNKKCKLYCDLSADVGTAVLILGYDENHNWIRTQQGGVWLDGEVVLASLAGTLSTKKFTVITGVQKPETNGYIRLFEYDTTLLTQRDIARYDYDETNPAFRVSYVPTLDTDATTDVPLTVEIMAKLDYIPVKRDTDYLIIQCIPALKDMCLAIQAAENEPDLAKKRDCIAAGLQMATTALEAEARHYTGAPQRHLSATGIAGPTLETIPELI